MTDRAIVYGTLRSGFHNDRLWRDSADVESGWLSGYRLYQVASATFPIVQSAGDDDRVRVDIVTWRSPRLAAEGLESMDWLEGAPDFYQRIETVAVTDAGIEQRGWLYVPSSRRLTLGARLIESGDYASVSRSSRV